MADERIRVTLTKSHAETPTGRELIALLTELSADGNVTPEEMERLRSWLEVDRDVDFAALGYLYEEALPSCRAPRRCESPELLNL
jgi:hypothetical protein